MKKQKNKSSSRSKIEVRNSLANYMSFSSMIGIPNGEVQQLSQPNTIIASNRPYFISINRTLLSYMYINYALMQVLVDVPVDDAYRGGVEFESSELDDDDLKKLYAYWNKHNILGKIKDLARWTRVFGGGGMVINTIGKPDSPLPVDRIFEDTPIDFYPADMWELSFQNTELYAEPKPYNESLTAFDDKTPYFFYGVRLDRSRVIKTKNKEAPSWLRMQLRGWGMSEMERAVREMNSKLKYDNLVFELLDEGKIDVCRIDGFNESMLDSGRSQEMASRIQTAMHIKNYQSALILDKDDEYEQKQLNLTGLSELSNQQRIDLSSAFRIPASKLFGMAPTGINSDDENGMENYNSMLESEIRDHYNEVFIEIGKLICKKILGYVPEDLTPKYKPLRILKSTEEQEVKDRIFNRVMTLYDKGLLTAQQAEEQINLGELLPNKIQIDEGYLEEFKQQEAKEAETPGQEQS